MFITYNFIFMLLIYSLAFASGDDAVSRFRWVGHSEAVIFSVITITKIAFLAIIITYIMQERIKAREIREFANFQFNKRAKETKLNLAEQTLLKSITWAVAPKMLADVFDSLVIFEAAVDIEIKKLIEKFGDDNPRTQNTADMIYRIRRKLGFDKVIVERALESTRNIEYGQVISLFCPTPAADNANGTDKGKTHVLNSNEMYFDADFSELENSFSQEERRSGVIARFTRQQDANYSVHLAIRSINSNDNIISFYHTTSLERHQARKYARISVDTDVQCKIIKRADESAKSPSAGEVLQNTTLNDISGGGLSFMAQQSLSIDDIALFTFTLNGQKFMIKGKIVSISAQEGKYDVFYKHRVVFYNPKQSDIERIVKFIYEKQREKIQLG